MVQSNAGQATRAILMRELNQAHREEVPKVLGYYGSCLRIETELPRAELVLKEAREIALAVEMPKVEAEILIRLGYVALEQQRLDHAVRCGVAATLISARQSDREGEGRGFLSTGMFRYYSGDYGGALKDLEALDQRPASPESRFSAYQISGLCWLALHRLDKARKELDRARQLTGKILSWMIAKLDWLESRLVSGPARLELLQAARSKLAPSRLADYALATIECIEVALAIGNRELAEQETSRLSPLLFSEALSPRITQAIARLFRQRSNLSPKLLMDIRRSLDQLISHRLNMSIDLEHDSE